MFLSLASFIHPLAISLFSLKERKKERKKESAHRSALACTPGLQLQAWTLPLSVEFTVDVRLNLGKQNKNAGIHDGWQFSQLYIVVTVTNMHQLNCNGKLLCQSSQWRPIFPDLLLHIHQPVCTDCICMRVATLHYITLHECSTHVSIDRSASI
uniref:Uncharacterized protein n=1 Tax=Arundo donax TaxID=35708 RepID=A0A0A9EZM3_ARUDO